MEIQVKTVSKAALGQLRPPSHADIQRSIDRAGWNKGRTRNHQQMMTELNQRAKQFVEMKQRPPKQQAQAKAAPDRPAPMPTPRHQPVTKDSYAQARGRSLTEKRMHVPSTTHLRANVQKAMRQNVRRAARAEARQQTMQRLTDRTKGAMRALGQSVLGRPPVPKRDQPQRARLQGIQAKNATEKRVEKKAEKIVEKGPNLINKYLGKLPSKQPEQQRGKEQQRGRDRSR